MQPVSPLGSLSARSSLLHRHGAALTVENLRVELQSLAVALGMGSWAAGLRGPPLVA